MLAGNAYQLVHNVWCAIKKCSLLGSLGIAIHPCMRFNPAMTRFGVLSQRADGIVSLREAETLSSPEHRFLGQIAWT